jgi:Ca2+-binding RTX toxin-like protein
MFGFDWATYKGNGQNADVDLARPIFTTEVQDVLRDRFDKVEAASGYTGNDLLVGDDRVYAPAAQANINATAEAVFFRDEINEAGIARITGLDEIITDDETFSGIYTSEFGDLKPGAVEEKIFAGNVLIGGAGDDVLVGKGGNDILDGDRWLNVRIRLTAPGAENTAANELATVDSLTHVFTAPQLAALGIDTAFAGRSLAALMIDRKIVPSQMHIVREILDGDIGNTGVDTAVFWDVRENYTFTRSEGGAFVVTHSVVGNPAVMPPGFANPVSDGVDTLRNIEMLRFGDGLGGVQTFTLREIYNHATTGDFVITGQPSREGSTLTATVGAIQDADGINLATQIIQWQSSVDGISWSNIPGANAAEFTPPALPGMQVSPFAANMFRAILSYTDNAGWAEQVTTAPTGRMGIVWSATTSQAAVTFTAFAGGDTLTGSSLDDTLDGADGDDTINGGGGADTLLGGAGIDRLLGGTGNDTMSGGAGDDNIDGQGGTADVAVFAGPVASYTYGTTLMGFGSDLVLTDTVGDGGTDTVARVETLRIAGVDYAVVMGGLGNDAALNGATGAAGSQIVFARTGNDTLNGGAASDILVGGNGNDTLVGGADNDFVFGDAGTDTIRQGSTEGRDFIDGGDGVDTYILNGVAGTAETFTIYARAAAITAGFGADLDPDTEIVVTHSVGAGPATVIAELDNIEEIIVNALETTAQNGDGVVNGGTAGGDTVTVVGDFTAPNTSLLYNTITINGSGDNDTVDITGLQSDHRIVFTTNGGADTVLGPVRTQDTINGTVNDLRSTGSPSESSDSFGAGDGVAALVGGQLPSDALAPAASADGEMSQGRTMIEMDETAPLDVVDTGPAMPVFLVSDPAVDVSAGDQRQVITDYLVS